MTGQGFLPASFARVALRNSSNTAYDLSAARAVGYIVGMKSPAQQHHCTALSIDAIAITRQARWRVGNNRRHAHVFSLVDEVLADFMHLDPRSRPT